MIKVERAKVYNITEAVYAARNALNSWDKSDSDMELDKLGPNDLGLAQRLYASGRGHDKYLRQIFVTLTITTDAFIWAELDTYKVNTTRNSCSFQHKGTSKPFELEFFSYEPLDQRNADVWKCVIRELNRLRDLYLATNDYECFRQIRKLLPSGWLVKSTLTLNYANVMNIINQRQHHKLKEWHELCAELRKLPYVKDIRNEH